MRIKRNTETYIFIGKYLLTTHTFESTLALFRTTLPALEYSIKKTYIFEESIFGERTLLKHVCLYIMLDSLSLTLSPAYLMHARTHARTHARWQTRTHARTHARTNACTHSRTHTHTHTQTHAHSHTISSYYRIPIPIIII